MMKCDHKEIDLEFQHYTHNERVLWVPGCNLASQLKLPFEAMIDIVNMIILSHIGNHTMLIEPTIQILAALVDEVQESNTIGPNS